MCELFLELSALNLLRLIAFPIEAFNKIEDAKALARAGYLKCALKGRLMHIHAGKHSTKLGSARVNYRHLNLIDAAHGISASFCRICGLNLQKSCPKVG
jgi:hypothetical protein